MKIFVHSCQVQRGLIKFLDQSIDDDRIGALQNHRRRILAHPLRRQCRDDFLRFIGLHALRRYEQNAFRGLRPRADLEAQRNELARRLGVEEKNHEDLLERADAAQHEGEVESVKYELRVAVREYARIALTDHLLDEALERFRREKQPAVLRRASGLWSIVTGGAWQAVRPTIEGENLEVVDSRGRVASVTSLSRGTAEQLYLCLRLALAETLADGGQTILPLVLDDVLVNFDDERAVATGRVLAEVARNRQVLLFGCRDHTVDLLREAGADPQVIRLPRFGGAAAPAEVDEPAPPLDIRQPATEGSDVESRILDILGSAGRPLGKSDVLALLGIDEGIWARSIRSLVVSGAVLMTGAKRGTRYTLPAVQRIAASRTGIAD